MDNLEDLIIKKEFTDRVLCSPYMFSASIGVSEHVVRHWIKEGVLPLVRIRKRVFINVVELKELLSQGNKVVHL